MCGVSALFVRDDPGVNGTSVVSVIDLRRALDGLKPRAAVVLQIERNDQFIV